MATETQVESVLVDAQALEEFAVQVFMRLGVTEANARDAAEVLVKADITGVDSHGVPRLKNYVQRLKSGLLKPNPDVQIVRELPSTALVDGDRGLGMIVGRRAMEIAIKKAEQTGSGFVSVRNSSHYGIAGFYARMALDHDMIGMSMTNVGPVGGTPPTYGRQGLFSTNPIAVAVPTRTNPPWVMDFATTVIAYGKLEIAMRRDQPIPNGWIMDKDSQHTHNPFDYRAGGYMLPLGGLKETGGHKGYGLMVLVDILCGVLSGAAIGAGVERLTGGAPARTDTGHFFGAWRVDGFRPLEEFKEEMDEMLRVIRSSQPMDGHDRIYTHGELDWETEADRRAHGIPLDLPTWQSLEEVAAEVGVPLEIRK